MLPRFGSAAICRRSMNRDPACFRCREVKTLSKLPDGRRVCRNCFARNSAVPCIRCGAVRVPTARGAEGHPLCPSRLVSASRQPGRAYATTRSGSSPGRTAPPPRSLSPPNSPPQSSPGCSASTSKSASSGRRHQPGTGPPTQPRSAAGTGREPDDLLRSAPVQATERFRGQPDDPRTTDSDRAHGRRDPGALGVGEYAQGVVGEQQGHALNERQ